MRGFIFRAWDIKGKRWISHEESGLLFLNFYTDGSGRFQIDEYDGEQAHRLGTNYVLTQYTGLKDKNDKGIWEGDIIEFDGNKIVVTWDKEMAGFVNFLYAEYSTAGEAIGNIHENPELLEKR